MGWRWVVLLLGAIAAGVAVAFLSVLRPPRMAARPESVPAGDREIAWLHTPTSFETWENFVWGVKRAEMAGDGGPDGLQVDDSDAFPDKTTAVPEIVVRRKGFDGALRVRWYKVTDATTQEDWVNALAARDPAPLAVLGGWSSDRAKTLAEAMRDAPWPGPGPRPLLFFATATADKVDPDDVGGQGPSLIAVYDRAFRFCFTNRQMAESVTDFVLSDPTLRPGPIAWPGLRSVPAASAGPWAAVLALGGDAADLARPLPGHTITWEDDPYSRDLSLQFRAAFGSRCPAAGFPSPVMTLHTVPFSVGRMNRTNPAEAEAADHILADLPPDGMRSVLVIPTVSAPARRTLRALVQGNPDVGRQLVAVTGDGISVNTFFRDREFSWPVRSIPVPFVFFTHADPFGWDTPGSGPPPPPGYELTPPRPGAVRSTTEDLRNYNRLTRVVTAAAFADGTAEVADGPDAVAARLRSRRPAFFDPSGDRLGGTGEHVVVLRPVFPGQANGRPHPDATLEVYTRRPDGRDWVRVHTQPLGRSGGRGE